MVTLLAGLESGIINPGTRFFCPGSLQIAGRKFHCWRKGGHGTVDAVTGSGGGAPRKKPAKAEAQKPAPRQGSLF